MKKHAAAAYRPRPPAMLIGDEEPAPAPLIPEQSREAASMLPDELRVAFEGSTTGRWPLVSAGLLMVALAGLRAPHEIYLNPTLGEGLPFSLATAGVCGALAWLARRYVVRHRTEFRLDDGGIVKEVWHALDARPWVTRIPWTEIAEYSVTVEADAAVLHVESVRGWAMTIADRPARLATRELIRRFQEQADRHRRPERIPRETASPRRWGGAIPRWIGYAGFAMAGWAFIGVVNPSEPTTYALLILGAGAALTALAWRAPTTEDVDPDSWTGRLQRLLYPPE
ncbi:MAG TPA: hypothetical protein VFT45_04165 [Longimicrobium sp.]|nr:hypothetical protein [Longimicrobium sp.]